MCLSYPLRLFLLLSVIVLLQGIWEWQPISHKILVRVGELSRGKIILIKIHHASLICKILFSLLVGGMKQDQHFLKWKCLYQNVTSLNFICILKNLNCHIFWLVLCIDLFSNVYKLQFFFTLGKFETSLIKVSFDVLLLFDFLVLRY